MSDKRRKLYLEMLVDSVVEANPEVLYLPPKEQIYNLVALYHQAQLLLFEQNGGRIRNQNLANESHDVLITADFLKNLHLEKSRVYTIAEKFGRHLDRTGLDVPCDLLQCPVGSTYMIELPFSYKGLTNEYHRCAIISIGLFREGFATTLLKRSITDDSIILDPETGVPLTQDQMLKNRAIAILAPDFDAEGNCKNVSSYFVAPLIDGRTIEDVILTNLEKGEGEMYISPKFIQMVSKCLLYIQSGDPDLRAEPGIWSQSKKEKKVRIHNRNHCRFDVVNVGYSYNGIRYHIDEAAVSGHFRWQRYGENLSKVKLIWIDEHVRKYK
jgi:hypothetical protein